MAGEHLEQPQVVLVELADPELRERDRADHALAVAERCRGERLVGLLARHARAEVGLANVRDERRLARDRDVAGQALPELERRQADVGRVLSPDRDRVEHLAVAQVDGAVVVVDQHPQLVHDRLADLAHVIQPVELAYQALKHLQMGDRADVPALGSHRPFSDAFFLEDDDAVLALRLCGHHRGLGAGDQLARVHRMLGPEGDPDREGGVDDGLRRATQERLLQARGQAERIVRPTRREDDCELLAADAADRVRAADDALEDLAEELEDAVTLAVAADVVDALEVVDVEHHQRDAVVRTARALELGAQPLVEVAVVVEARQRVGVRQVFQARPDLRVVERQRRGVAEPARQLELVLVERRVLARAVDVQRPLHRAAGDQRHGDQRLRVLRRPRDEGDARIEVGLVREHGAAVLDRPARDPLAVEDRIAEDLLHPGCAAREHGPELTALLVRLVDVQVLVRDQLGERIGDPVEQRLGALLREHIVEHRRQTTVRLDQRLRASRYVLAGIGRRVRQKRSVGGHRSDGYRRHRPGE